MTKRVNKYLVYYVLLFDGEKFRKARDYESCLNLSIDSLGLTNYQGDIIVISNFKYTRDGVKNIVVPTEEAENLRPFGCLLKSKIQKYIDLKEYDFVLYLDIDILINNNCNFMEYLDNIERGDYIYCQEHRKIKLRRGDPFVCSYLSEEELERYRHSKFRPCCTGVLGFCGTDFSINFLNKWFYASTHPKYPVKCRIWVDQPAFNALILREYKEEIRYLSVIFSHKKIDRHSEFVFIHFKAGRGMGRSSKVDYMREYFNNKLK